MLTAKLMAVLIASFGLAPNATNDQAIAHLKSLSDDQRAALSEAVGADGAAEITLLMKPPAAKPVTALAANPASNQADEDVDAQVVLLEQKRTSNIHALAAAMGTGTDESVQKALKVAALGAIALGLSLVQARTQLQKAMSEACKSIAVSPDSASVHVGEDQNIASLRAAIPQAIFLRSNPGVELEKFEKFEKREQQDQMRPGRVYLGKIHERAFALRRQTVLGMFRTYLTALGARGHEDMSNVALANALGPKALRTTFPKLALLAESTSDFANISLDAINKTMRFMYLDAPRTWTTWAQRQTNNDFKNINRVVLSEAPDMIAATEGKEINYVALTDSKETYSLSEYKAGIKLTRRAIINDDLDAFNQIPRAQANSAARKEDDVAYAILTGNAAMADAGLLFNSTAVTTAGGHANLAGSGTAISISSLQTAATAIMKQKGLANAARLELQPKFLLVPTSIFETTRQLIGSDTLIGAAVGDTTAGKTATQVGNRNPFFNRYQVIGSTRLDDNSATRWYLAADYRDGQINTVEVCFLTDEPEPVVRQETDFDTEDVKYLVRHTVAAKAIDYRGLYANPGA